MKQKSENKEKGDIGEEEAKKYLVNQGYKILERNYWRKWGELDIVCIKDNVLHFVEVKSVTHEIMGDYDPEDNVHYWKRRRLKNIISTYLEEKYPGDEEEPDWQVDLVAIYLGEDNRSKKIDMLEDIEL